jgi:hypothetical protein
MSPKFIFLSLIFICACRPSPYQVKALTPTKPRQIEAPTNQSRNDFDEDKKVSLKKRYQELKSPSFALINGYYRLPNAAPFGSATVVREFSYVATIEALKIESAEQNYAITPMAGDEAMALHDGLNALLNLGVHVKELSMSDAVALANAESKAANNKSTFIFAKHLPPGVDYLISINKSSSERGPVLVGRVVSKEGRLLAFRVLYHSTHHRDVSALILSLFEDTVNRI